MRRARARQLGAFAASAVLLIGCSSGSKPNNAGSKDPTGGVVNVPKPAPSQAFVSTAGLKSEESTTASYQFSIALAAVGQAGPAPISISGKGSYDLSQPSTNTVVDMSTVLNMLTASDIERDPRLALMFSEPLEFISTTESVYMKGGLATYASFFVEGPEREWVKVSAKDSNQFAGFASFDSSNYLALLRGAGKDVKQIGTEEVRNVMTTRYRTTVNVGDAMAKAQGLRKQAVEQLSSTLGDTNVLDVEVWIDSDGLVRRLQVPIAFAAFIGETKTKGGAAARPMRISLEFFDYGKPVTFVVPSAAIVSDLSVLPEFNMINPADEPFKK